MLFSLVEPPAHVEHPRGGALPQPNSDFRRQIIVKWRHRRSRVVESKVLVDTTLQLGRRGTTPAPIA